MLPAGLFYKTTPKIMKSSARSKRTSSPVGGQGPTARKKQRVRSSGVLVERFELEGGSNLCWSPRVVVSKLPRSATGTADGYGGLVSAFTENLKIETTHHVTAVKSEMEPSEVMPRRSSSRVASMRRKTAQDTEEEIIEEEEVDDQATPLPSDDLRSNHRDNEDGLSEYERRRLENIRENANFFASLGISSAKSRLTKQPAPGAASKLKVRREPLERRPPSLRLQRINPDGGALPPKLEPTEIDFRKHPPSGPIDMEPVNEVEGGRGKVLTCVTTATEDGPDGGASLESDDLAGFVERIRRLQLKPQHTTKVVAKRICSLAVHPSRSKVIVCVGGKGGNIGVWDVDSVGDQLDVYQFEPHVAPVYGLQFSPGDPTKLYSSSYDGTIRCGDFVAGVFEEISNSENTDAAWYSSFDFLTADGQTLIAAQNQHGGHAQLIDTRLRSQGNPLGHRLHERNVKTIHVHPIEKQYFMTASSDSTIALWDVRMLKEHRISKPVATAHHGRSVSSAYFSPVTGRKIVTTSMDNHLRTFAMESSGQIELQAEIPHLNTTGRWLTPFRTVWHPRREDTMLVGSMDYPRKIQLFDDKGQLLFSFQDELLNSICGINAFHPTRDILVGGNSSGKLYTFM